MLSHFFSIFFLFILFYLSFFSFPQIFISYLPIATWARERGMDSGVGSAGCTTETITTAAQVLHPTITNDNLVISSFFSNSKKPEIPYEQN